MIVDFHNHMIPESFLDKLARYGGPYGIELGKDKLGRKLIVVNGIVTTVVVDKMHRPETRIPDMDANGVDVQAISFSAWTRILNHFPPEMAVELAAAANEEMVAIVKTNPSRFAGMATVSLHDVESAIAEVTRAVRQLGLRAVIVMSNFKGKNLDDQEFWPFYQRIQELEIPMFVHPSNPIGYSAVAQYRLAAIMGFEFDLAIGLARLVFGGVLEAYPRLKVVVAHLAGVLPFLVARIENGYNHYSKEDFAGLSRPPMEYLRNVYLDTVSFHVPALTCTYADWGAGRMVMGSDYPHVIGDLARGVTSIEAMSIPPAEKRMILGNNAAALLKIS
ncbi:MAG: amidohydrolase family protein [Chloroflexi bacterium]|nr:amidohydrolase family protein [Chloroflexota bacterium]